MYKNTNKKCTFYVNVSKYLSNKFGQCVVILQMHNLVYDGMTSKKSDCQKNTKWTKYFF